MSVKHYILTIAAIVVSVQTVFSADFSPFAGESAVAFDVPTLSSVRSQQTRRSVRSVRAVRGNAVSAVQTVAGSSYRVLPQSSASSGVMGSGSVYSVGNVGGAFGTSSYSAMRNAAPAQATARSGVSDVFLPFGTGENTNNTIMRAPVRPGGPSIGELVPIGDAMWFMLLLPLVYAFFVIKRKNRQTIK